ncbi:hypothetical protein LUZ61_000793 [Rhynchospora tenuis]|uniref:Uncharacterized protein n=1 Tax=Rhynchospora tenuis TaxID=198213 RepID=A0AAD5ZG14_9POAL|nr:hypothetical protein LUZ61_000793 [Rhynchospora tenuis]
MASGTKILRRSLHAFFNNYQSFASTATFMLFPFSLSLLLSQSLPFLPQHAFHLAVSSRLRSIFASAGFPSNWPFFSLLNSKLCQSTFSFILTLPFSLSSLLLCKAFIISTITHLPSHKNQCTIYKSLLYTHFFNSFVVLFSNAAVFSLLFLFFNTFGALNLTSSHVIFALSALGVIIYSIILANTSVACNVAYVVAAVENRGGYMAIIKSLILLRGGTATAVAVSLPASIGTAAIEALFQFRVARPFKISGNLQSAGLCEGLLIAYLYSMVVVVDTIVTCMVYQSFKKSCDYSDFEFYGEILERKERSVEA